MTWRAALLLAALAVTLTGCLPDFVDETPTPAEPDVASESVGAPAAPEAEVGGGASSEDVAEQVDDSDGTDRAVSAGAADATTEPELTQGAPALAPDVPADAYPGPVTGSGGYPPPAATDPTPSAPGADASLSGDMLSPREARRAESLALSADVMSPVVSSAVDRDAVLSAAGRSGADGDEAAAALSSLSERPSYRVLYTQRWPGKMDETRAAEVVVLRYDTGQATQSRVDLETSAVEARALDPSFPLPIAPAEIDEATVVARADPRVRAALEEAGLSTTDAAANALLTRTADPTSACAANRCLRLFFSSLEAPVPQFSVIVDLVALDVVEIEPMPRRSDEP